jgi:electron transport complex protein RnfD
MQFKTRTSPFFNSSQNINGIMLQVLLALIPGSLVMIFFFGWGILFNIILSILFAVSFETIALKIRKRPILPFLTDLSAITTAWLFALTLPPLVPWWIVLVGIFFAIIIAKHLYGGIGYNPFNPAMVGYAVLIVSFPFEMSQWLQPGSFGTQEYGFIDSLRIIFSDLQKPNWDAITSATPLDEVKTGLRAGTDYKAIVQQSSYLQSVSQNTWIWSSLAYAAGGFWLLYKKVIQWQIPFALLTTLGMISSVFYLFSPVEFASPLFHLVSGASVLGAFFIATDPVSASTTPLGKIIYGASIGFFIYIIRVWGNYPDAVAFAVLIMNMAVPMIDYYTQPRVLGHKSAFSSSPKKSDKKT